MKRIVLLLAVWACVLLAGCGRGMVDTRAERDRRVAGILDIEERQIQDDWDEFWFFDQNLQLTDWDVYLGH